MSICGVLDHLHGIRRQESRVHRDAGRRDAARRSSGCAACAPTRRSSRSPCSWNTFTTPDPTVPKPEYADVDRLHRLPFLSRHPCAIPASRDKPVLHASRNGRRDREDRSRNPVPRRRNRSPPTLPEPLQGTPCVAGDLLARVRPSIPVGALRMIREATPRTAAHPAGASRRVARSRAERRRLGPTMQHSASATASPPSAQSCAERTIPARMASRQAACTARSRARSRRRRSPRLQTVDRP